MYNHVADPLLRGGVHSSQQPWILNERNKIMSAAQRRDSSALRQAAQVLRNSMGPKELDHILLLHYVVFVGDMNDVAVDLIAYGCNIYASDMHGDCVIHFAVRSCNHKILRYLVHKEGYQILSVLNNAHFNPMLTACAEAPDDRAYEILLLLEWLYLHGVSLEMQDHQGKTAVMWAAQRGSITVVQWLLSRGANLAHRDHSGRTVMHMAAMSGEEETIIFLAERGGANLVHCQSIDDIRVRTPCDICIRRGHYNLALQMKLWPITRSILGRIVMFRNSYAWYYWLMSVMNLMIGVGMLCRILMTSITYWPVAVIFLALWSAQATCWIIAFNADPGFVKRNVIPDQSYRCSENILIDIDKKPVFRASAGSSIYRLHHTERDSMKVSADLIELNRKYRKTPGGEAQFEKCAQRLQNCREGMHRLMERVAQERRNETQKQYWKGVIDGQAKRLCLTCRIVKPFRAHHCSDCAHCIHRFDHHCIWVDNCVGKGNQRSFWHFLLFITLSMFGFWALFFLYLKLLALRVDGYPSYVNMMKEPILYLALFNSCFNILWASFVGYLFCRTSKSMCTNVTFYETLRRPVHIQRRFEGRTQTCLGDMSDLTFAKLLRHLWSFFSLDDTSDQYDYGETYQQMVNDMEQDKISQVRPKPRKERPTQDIQMSRFGSQGVEYMSVPH